VARALVGVRIVHVVRGKARIARIVETEAYRGPRDLACHARAGLTRRTRALFGPPGHAYVFFVYGMHECFNVVCKATGSGHAVLVRAAEAVEGFTERADGPARLTRALGISRAHDGVSLLDSASSLYLLGNAGAKRPHIGVSARVGVGYAGTWADEPYRFFDLDSAHVSKPPRSSVGRGA
jgi:DNA-3-methyladenine glycosylase